MSVNSPSASRLFPSSNSTIEQFYKACLDSVASTIIYTAYTFTNAAFLPLYAFILFMGFQQRRRRRHTPSAATMSHSDLFTIQMTVVEIIGVLGSICYVLGVKSEAAVLLGVFLFGCIFPGQSSFHVLTCVERYLAVVHAIKHMQLSETPKVRVRDVSTVVVWLLRLGWLPLLKLYRPGLPTVPLLPFVIICLFVTTFCCLSVLRLLRHPGPGELNPQRVDPAKLRAFNMIVAITAALLLRIVGLFVTFGLVNVIPVDQKHLCLLMDSDPSRLITPGPESRCD